MHRHLSKKTLGAVALVAVLLALWLALEVLPGGQSRGLLPPGARFPDADTWYVEGSGLTLTAGQILEAARQLMPRDAMRELDTEKDEALVAFVQEFLVDALVAREATRQGIDAATDWQQARQQFEDARLPWDFLAEHIATHFQLNDRDIREFHDENPARFETPAMYVIVRLPVLAAKHGGRKQAYQRIVQAREEISQSKSVESVVRKYSDALLGQEFREIGPMKAREFPAWEQATIESLAVGQWSEPLETETGYELIYMQRQTPRVVPAFEEIQGEVRYQAALAQIEVLRGQLIKELKDSIVSEVYPEYLPHLDLDPELPVFTVGATDSMSLDEFRKLCQREEIFGLYAARKRLTEIHELALMSAGARQSGFDHSEAFARRKQYALPGAQAEFFLSQRISGEIEVSTPEVLAYFDSHLGDFRTPFRAQLRELMITPEITSEMSPGAAAEARQKAYRRLMELREEIRSKGTPFAEMARRHSQAPSAADGGSLGWLHFPTSDRRLTGLVMNARPGQILQPCQTLDGNWTLFMVEDTEPPRWLDFEEAAPFARSALLAEKRQQVRQDWLRNFISGFNLDINDELSKALITWLKEQSHYPERLYQVWDTTVFETPATEPEQQSSTP